MHSKAEDANILVAGGDCLRTLSLGGMSDTVRKMCQASPQTDHCGVTHGHNCFATQTIDYRSFHSQPFDVISLSFLH